MRRRRAAVAGKRGRWFAFAAIVVLGGTLASVLVARSIARTDAEKARLGFHLSSDQIASTLRLAIQHEEDLVVSASAFVASNPHATPLEFDAWAGAVRALARFPELQNFGLVAMIPAASLPSVEARLAAHPVQPFGPGSRPPGAFQIVPQGNRPFYCLAVAGMARDARSLLPAGLDYCALAPTLAAARETGLSSYAPFIDGSVTTLGVQTPLYRGGVVPATADARRRAFVGWLGELLEPKVVIDRALVGHANTAVRFSYSAGASHVALYSGVAPANGQRTTIDLHNGWTVQSFGTRVATGIADDRNALTVLVAGALISLLGGLLILVLGTGRTRALSLVKEKTRELSHQALHDALTGLPNRALVLDRAEQMLARAARQPGVVAGALFVDVDGFKHVNDKLGHAAGDRLLKVVGERLQKAVRVQDTVGRLGGDEFVVLVESSAGDAPLDLLADRLIEALHAPVELEDGRELFSVTASVGVAAGHYTSPDDLLRDADLALYAAKAAGKDRYVLFDPSMYADAEGSLELEADLGAAVNEGRLFLLYQPIVDLSRQQVLSVEALVRWRHPTRGVVTPNLFIPLAEENGLIVPIDRWVLDEACRQAAAWSIDGRRVGISVNVSAYQLGRRSFVEDVRRALRDSGIAPTQLTLEITETTLVRDATGAAERLNEIKALGVRIAIDDFGTGYASISHLQRMPIDMLKVDRSFVAALGDGSPGPSRELLGAILGVGQALSLAVVAEGVEEDSQVATLEEMGCTLAQGYLIGKPTTPAAIEALLSRGPVRRAVGSPAA